MKLYLNEEILKDTSLSMSARVFLNYLLMIWYAADGPANITVEKVEKVLGLSTIEAVYALNELTCKNYAVAKFDHLSSNNQKVYSIRAIWDYLCEEYPSLYD